LNWAHRCRKIGVTEPTHHHWKNKYVGMLPSDMQRLRQLEEENAKL
jgi:putative transposase